MADTKNQRSESEKPFDETNPTKVLNVATPIPLSFLCYMCGRLVLADLEYRVKLNATHCVWICENCGTPTTPFPETSLPLQQERTNL